MHLQVFWIASVLPGPLAADDGEGSEGSQKLHERRIIVTRHLAFLRRSRERSTMLGTGSEMAEMKARNGFWQQELEGLNAQARELEARIAANVARILGA